MPAESSSAIDEAVQLITKEMGEVSCCSLDSKARADSPSLLLSSMSLSPTPVSAFTRMLRR